MEWIIVLAIVAFIILYFKMRAKPSVDVSHLPKQFVVFDLETTGLNPYKNEIIEIGAIRVNRDSVNHDTFQRLVKPSQKVPKKITELTGITQSMIDSDAKELEASLLEFISFVGELRLVSFNAKFDMSFLENAANKYSLEISNSVSCALEMARRAWPGRDSYKLADLARDGNLDDDDTHRALGDCHRALIIYTAAAAQLRTIE